jgi:hypothetical protein
MPSDLIDPLSKIFEDIKGSDSDKALELFKKTDIALRTDLTHKEHVLVSAISTENDFFNDSLPDFNLYGRFLSHFLSLKTSLDRQSRKEFVAAIQQNTIDRDLERVANLNNLTESRK